MSLPRTMLALLGVRAIHVVQAHPPVSRLIPMQVTLARLTHQERRGRRHVYPARPERVRHLYTVVRDSLETFRVEAARLRDGDGLPRFVEAQFQAFLKARA
jgi:hypothetical protein